MAELIQRGILPTLEQLDDAGKAVVVDSAGTNYVLGTTGGGAMPLTCETDSVTICPGTDPIPVVGNFGGIRPLDSVTDSVTVIGDFAPPRPPDWAITHAPLSGERATATKSAIVGLSHVAT